MPKRGRRKCFGGRERTGGWGWNEAARRDPEAQSFWGREIKVKGLRGHLVMVGVGGF